jgi:hypothetical protein
VARGTLDLAYRDDVHGAPAALEPGVRYDVELELEACAYAFDAGQRLRLSLAGADWPNTVAPPGPVQLTVHRVSVELPLWSGNQRPAPTLPAGSSRSGEDPSGITWTTTDDVLRRTTTCAVRHGAEYPVPFGGTASEKYAGEVTVDRRTFDQRADATCTFRLTWPEADVSVSSRMRLGIGADGYDVHIDAVASENGTVVGSRSWEQHVDR